MSKKTPIKKTKRRLKRTVRRSLAAVLMITAIAVAAIPVPENYAESGAGGSSSSSTVPVPAKYAYPTTLSSTVNDATLKTNLPDNDLFRSYIITPLSDGTYQMDWQFKFFSKIVEGNPRGIIAKYNSTYQQDTVELNPNVIYEYYTIKQDTYNTFYTNKGDTVYSCTGAPDLAYEDDIFLNEYFNDLYKDYSQKYTQYEKDYEAWSKDPGRTEETKPKAPSLSKTPNDLTEDQKLKYYCDKTAGLAGCTLAKVIDAEHPAQMAKIHIYIFRKRLKGRIRRAVISLIIRILRIQQMRVL